MYESQPDGLFEPGAMAHFRNRLGSALRSERREWAETIIREFREMQRDPSRAASEIMAAFLSEAGLLSVAELNFTFNSVGAHQFAGARLRKRLKIHHRVLLHAVLSGFLPLDQTRPLFQTLPLEGPSGTALN